jgi:hypothetical protein
MEMQNRDDIFLKRCHLLKIVNNASAFNRIPPVQECDARMLNSYSTDGNKKSFLKQLSVMHLRYFCDTKH